MSDKRVSFPVLEDIGSKVGLPIHKTNDGDALSGRNAIPAIGFKDASGNLHYGLVDADGRLVVSANAGDEAGLWMPGELVNGSLTEADITGASITLVPGMTYIKLAVTVSCSRDAKFKVIHVDDATSTTVLTLRTGAGNQTLPVKFDNELTIVAGSTGTQTLKVVGMNMDLGSDLDATIAVTELQN